MGIKDGDAGATAADRSRGVAEHPSSGADMGRRELLQAVLNLSEAARCLGVAQAREDQGAIDYWSAESKQYEDILVQRPVPSGKSGVEGLAREVAGWVISALGDLTEDYHAMTTEDVEGALLANAEHAPAFTRQPASVAIVGVEGLTGAARCLRWLARTADPDDAQEAEAYAKKLEAALSQNPAAHADEQAVDAFAAAMKEKLAAARAKGRGGWNGDEPGMQQRLSDMLRDHVSKGDPRDVGNFAMFLHQRGESILPAQQTVSASPPEWALRGALAFVGQRTDGSLRELAERCELWMRESMSLIGSPIPKQSAATDKETIVVDGRIYSVDTVRTALLGLAADFSRTRGDRDEQ